MLNKAAIAEKSMSSTSLSLAHSRGVTPPRAMRLQRHKASIKIKAQRMKIDSESEANYIVNIFVVLEASRSWQPVDPVKIKKIFS